MSFASLVVVVALAVPAAQDGVEKRIAVLPLEATSAESAGAAKLFTTAITEGLGHQTDDRVLSLAEVKSAVNLNAQQKLAGCLDASCSLDIAKLIQADRIVTGRVGNVGSQTLVFATLMDLKEGRVQARASVSYREGKVELRTAAKTLARQLLDPTVQDATGDRPLTDLRMAIVVDEYDHEGKPLRRRPVEACVNKALLSRDAILVSASQIRAMKGLGGGRELLSGGVPDAMTSDDVDVLVVGEVEYTDVKTRGNGKEGVLGMSGALTLQMIRVDTGEIVHADSFAGSAGSFTETKVKRLVVRKMCDVPVPKSLETAMKKRIESGMRMVVDVEGVGSAAAAAKLAREISKLPRVARARVRNARGGKASLDVRVRGGDGVLLGLAADSKLTGWTVASAEPARLKLVRQK